MIQSSDTRKPKATARFWAMALGFLNVVKLTIAPTFSVLLVVLFSS